MIIELPVLPATLMRFHGERTTYLVQRTELYPFEVATATASDCPVERQMEIDGTQVTWHHYRDELVRPILTPVGKFADMDVLRNATGPDLVNVGSTRSWWHDHPSSHDRAMLWARDPLKSPIFPETVARPLEWVKDATQVVSAEQDALRIAKAASRLVLVDGVPHTRAPLWGWMVSVRAGDIRSKPWLPGTPGPKLSPTMFFPGDEKTIAARFVDLIDGTESLRHAKRPALYYANGEADQATLRSVLMQLQATHLGSLDVEFLDTYARAREALLSQDERAYASLLVKVSMACKASGNRKLSQLGRLIEAREALIARPLVEPELTEDEIALMMPLD